MKKIILVIGGTPNNYSVGSIHHEHWKSPQN